MAKKNQVPKVQKVIKEIQSYQANNLIRFICSLGHIFISPFSNSNHRCPECGSDNITKA